MTSDSGSRRDGENSRSEVEGVARQNGGAAASPNLPPNPNMQAVAERDLHEFERRITEGYFYEDYDEDLRLLGVFRKHLAALPPPDHDGIVQVDPADFAPEAEMAVRTELDDLCAKIEADAVSGLRYIEKRYGRLEGVGWDRVFDAHDELFRRAATKQQQPLTPHEQG